MTPSSTTTGVELTHGILQETIHKVQQFFPYIKHVLTVTHLKTCIPTNKEPSCPSISGLLEEAPDCSE